MNADVEVCHAGPTDKETAPVMYGCRDASLRASARPSHVKCNTLLTSELSAALSISNRLSSPPGPTWWPLCCPLVSQHDFGKVHQGRSARLADCILAKYIKQQREFSPQSSLLPCLTSVLLGFCLVSIIARQVPAHDTGPVLGEC